MKLNNRIKILVCEFHQESNSFNPQVCGLSFFKNGVICEGKEVIEYYENLPSALNGMFTAIREVDGEIIPSCAMHAGSGGRVDHALLEEFLQKTLKVIANNKDINGIFVSLHGATITTETDDACGDILETLRSTVGREVVISASFDLHANVTERMLKNADFICGYQTYPHVDFFETGYRAAKLGLNKILGGLKTYTAAAMIPMIVPASGYSTDTSPFKDIMQYAKSLVQENCLIDFSIFQMQPWLDVQPAATTVLAVSHDEEASKYYAKELAKLVYDNRDRFWPKLFSMDEIIDIAESNRSGKPVILVDSSDSPNGGACGDSVAVLLHLIERKSTIKAASIVNDEESVKLALQVGIGGRGLFHIGAGITPGIPGPLVTEAYVKSLHDGIFIQEGPAGRGVSRNIGPAGYIRQSRGICRIKEFY